MFQWLDIATIANKKGLDGGLVLKASANPHLRIEPGMKLSLVPPQIDAPRHVVVEEAERAGNGTIVVHVSDVDSIAVAEKLIGCHCLVAADDLELPEFAGMIDLTDSLDLLGWTVKDTNSAFEGIVVDAVDRTDQILLSVSDASFVCGEDTPADTAADTPSDRIKLIPLSDGILVDADADNRVLMLDCPPGLLEL